MSTVRREAISETLVKGIRFNLTKPFVTIISHLLLLAIPFIEHLCYLRFHYILRLYCRQIQLNFVKLLRCRWDLITRLTGFIWLVYHVHHGLLFLVQCFVRCSLSVLLIWIHDVKCDQLILRRVSDYLCVDCLRPCQLLLLLIVDVITREDLTHPSSLSNAVIPASFRSNCWYTAQKRSTLLESAASNQVLHSVNMYLRSDAQTRRWYTVDLLEAVVKSESEHMCCAIQAVYHYSLRVGLWVIMW